MRRRLMSAGLVLMMLLPIVSPLAQASEDWGLNCYRMAPFLDVLTMRLVRPNPPEWNLEAQVEWNGLNVYVVPGGGDWHTDLNEKIYAFHLTMFNTSEFFGGQPIMTLRGVVGGPWTLEARGKPGVAPFITQGTIEAAICPDEVVTPDVQRLSVQMGAKALAGSAPQ